MLKTLYKRAEELAGRAVEVEKTAHGKYAVLWFNFSSTPSAPADTEEGALNNFIEKLESLKNEEKPDAN